MLNLATLATALQTLFTTTALALAHKLALVRRRRAFCPSRFAQGLVFGWLQTPDATLSQLGAGLAAAGCVFSTPALSQHLNAQSANFLLELLQAAARLAFSAHPVALPLLSRFTAVAVLDATTLSLPDALASLWRGCGGTTGPSAAIKAVVSWELLGGLLRLDLLHGKDCDVRSPLVEQPLPRGSLRLADLGFFDLDTLQRYAEQGVYYISRAQPNTVVLDSQGRKSKLWEYLTRQPRKPLDEWIHLGVKERMPCRLVASPCPERIAQKRREAAVRRAVKHGHEVNVERLSICDWTFFVTNVPQEKLSGREVWVVYRVRWQIERLFKLWKSQGKLNETRGHDEERILCEVYAKMLGMLVRHWLLLTRGGWWLGRSMWKATAAVSLFGLLLLLALPELDKLVWLLEKLRQVQEVAGNVDRRKKKPATFETLENPENDGMEWIDEVASPTTPLPQCLT